MKKILIPSAKIVSQELQHIGKLPSVIYPLNQGVVLDRILECYRQADASFELILHEKANKVRHYVSSCGLGSNINLHVLDEVRDLGYSIYCGIRDAGFREGDTAVIHFGDTILYDVMPDHGDVCFYSEDIPTDTWTFFNEEEGRITEIWDKNLDGSSGTGLRKFFTGVFCLEHPATFLQMLSEAMEHGHPEDSFYTALAAYSVKYPLQMKKAEKWFDIGHADRYTGARMEVEARVFNHIVIDRERGILRKTSEEREKFIGEILWYLKLPSDIEYVRPRIFSYSTDYTSPYIEMEYYSYHTLHELFLYGDIILCMNCIYMGN